LVTRLQRYAAGNPDAFCDISVDFGQASEFRRRVLNLCRRIPFGRTVSYAELAARAGSPRAARAVGNCMAANPIPLLIPCHRVICADSRIGVYSAPGGTAMKQRLLAMEQREGVAIPHN
jgi:methylated-DNA-[protein]-cysteine S-methyltransferase